MNILGISSLDNNSSATVLVDGRIAAAVAEERLTRVKMQAGFPARAIDEVLRLANLGPRDIDAVAYPFYRWPEEARRIGAGWLANVPGDLRDGGSLPQRARHLWQYTTWCKAAILYHRRFGRELHRELGRRGWLDRLHHVEHHQAHAASAYFTAGVEEALVFTLDWYGGGLAGSVSLGRPDGLTRLKDFVYPNSLGLFYAQVTMALGFKVSRHEGKIVGLAAFGDPAILYDRIRSRFTVADGDLRYRTGMDMRFAPALAARYPREHVAAAYQRVLEDVVQQLVSFWVQKTGVSSVVLAGGVAANVKMNQRVRESAGVEHVFIHPAMGDDGTGTGAALQVGFEHGEVKPFELEDVYLGAAYPASELRSAMERGGLTPVRVPDIEHEVARRIARGQVVAHFDGRMEYGPRALGNRSILYHAQDPAVNAWLNKRLNRTEFMPFAPATLIESAGTYYRNLAGTEHAARFMTITSDCTEAMKRESPAAVHVDGTARPQLVDPIHAPRFHKILTAYQALTGIPTVINTSFNMHEEPIVCTPDDAVRAFNEGALDVLVLGDYLAERPGLAASGGEGSGA
jgi:carbamoyltransferase